MRTLTKLYDDPIEVEVEGPPSRSDSTAGPQVPVAFSWRGKRYQVERVLKFWREAGEGWEPERANDHECYRVEAAGGTYDLRLDRLPSRTRPHWRLARVWD